MVQDSLPYGNDWQSTLVDNPEDWLLTSSMRELLEKEGPGASASAIAGGAATAAVQPAKPVTEDFPRQFVSKSGRMRLLFSLCSPS